MMVWRPVDGEQLIPDEVEGRIVDITARRPVDREEPLPDEVKEALAQGLREHFGRAVRIVELRSKSLGAFISTHPIWRLRLTLDSGEQLTVIFKRLQPRPDRDVRRRILIHQRLLADGRLDAPTVYASVCDEARGRYWVFLEDVGELQLNWCDVDVWPAAYRWLARMHATWYGREEELRALRCLGEHSPAFYRFFARNAWEVLQRYAGRSRLVRFERLMTRWFDVSVAYLEHQPRTLVHGDLYCTNLMVQPGPRIRPIDWDSASIGVAGWDMAQLIAGWGLEKKSHFIKIYLDEFALQDTAATLDRLVFERTLAHSEVMRVLQVLYWWEGPYEDLAFVDSLLDEMEIACRYFLDGEGSYG
jgi:aminoglycoside/choline kinase family phosphotransferase